MAIQYNVKAVLKHARKIEVDLATIDQQPHIDDGHRLVAVIDNNGWIGAYDATEPTVDYFGFAIGVRNRFWRSIDFYLLPENHIGACGLQKEDFVSLEMLVAFMQSPEYLNRDRDPTQN